MKKSLILLLSMPAFLSLAQEAPKSNIFLGIQSGFGKITNFDSNKAVFCQEYGLSAEFESASKKISLRLLPAISYAYEKSVYPQDGYINTFESHYTISDFSCNVRFNIPVEKFRFSFELGPGISYMQRKSRYSSTLPDGYYGYPTNYSDNSANVLLLSNFGMNASYDCSEHLRVWLGMSTSVRVQPILFDSDAYAAWGARIGVAWRISRV